MNNLKFQSVNSRYIWIVLLGCIAGVHTEIVTLIAITLWISYKYHNWCKVSNRWKLFCWLLFFHGIFSLYLTGYTHQKFFQQFFLLYVTYFSYNLIFTYCRIKPEKWFEIYLKIAYFISIVGLIEFLIKHSANIDIFPYTLDGFPTQKAGRLHAFLAEAGSFVAFTTPAIAYIILVPNYYKENKMKFVTILTAYFLTVSTSMVVSLTIIILIKLYKSFKHFKYILLLSVLYGMGWLITNYSQFEPSNREATTSGMGAVHLKLYETMLVLETASPYDYENLNLSSYAALTNYWVAFNAPYRLFGTGLGTHSQNYEHLYKSSFEGYGLNKDDGYSLFARLFSEFGIIGICLYIFFLIKCYNKQNIISLSLLVFFISYLIKGGHYTLYGTAFFHFLYYIIYKNKKHSLPTIPGVKIVK